MNSSPAIEWREALRDDLRVAGDPALRMLRREAPLDALVLLSALQAAGLLDEATCGGDALRATRESLLNAVHAHPNVAAEAIAQADLTVGLLDAEDRIDALHRLVALAGLAHALPYGSVRAPVDDALAIEDAALAMAELDDSELRDAAGLLTDALDLAQDHPAAPFLELLSEPLAAPDEALLAEGVLRAQAELFPSTLNRWVARLQAEVARWLQPIALERAPAYGAVEDIPRVQDRKAVHQDAQQDVCLVRVGDALALEWAGDGPAPEEAALGDTLLKLLSQHADVRVWSLGEPPPGPLVVTLKGTGRAPLTIDLGGR